MITASGISAISILFLLSLSIFSSAGSYVQSDNNLWYPSKTVKTNTFLKYKIYDSELNNGSSYEMIIYFKDHDIDNGHWLANIFVVYDGKIISGTYHLDDDRLVIIDNSDVTTDMKPFEEVYSNTVDRLAHYSRSPAPLNFTYWGNISTANGDEIHLEGIENTTVPAGTFSCTLFTFKESKIWLNKDLPYPVQEQLISDLATPNPPLRYSIELEEMGEGYPKVIPEFPFALVVLIIGIIVTLVITRMKWNQISYFTK